VSFALLLGCGLFTFLLYFFSRCIHFLRLLLTVRLTFVLFVGSDEEPSANPRRTASGTSVMQQIIDVRDSSTTDSGISALFDEEEDESPRICWDCGVTLTPSSCYPPGSWGDTSQLAVRCKRHWDEHMSPSKAKLQKQEREHQLEGVRIRNKRKALQAFANSESPEPKNPNKKKSPKPKKTNKKKSPKPKKINKKKTNKPKKTNNHPLIISKYQWVDAKWGSKFYRAFVCMVNVAAGEPPNYDLYFIEDGETSPGVPASDVRVCPVEVGSFWATQVDQFVGETFTHDGRGKVKAKGVFKIDKMIDNNEYVCTRLAEGRRKALVKSFPVFKVVMTLKKQREKVRES